MDSRKLREVFSAYLHDPPEKPYLILYQGPKVGHESYTWNFYLRRFEDAEADVREEDQVASHFDRLPFYFPQERKSGYEWSKNAADLIFIHPMSRHRQTIVTAEQLKYIYDYFLENGGFSAEILQGVDDTDLKSLIRLFWNLSIPHIAKLPGVSTHIGSSIIPADTRVPYHTVVDHLEITAALKAVGGIEQASLLVFNIREAQNFISKSIKVADLWAGSMLLAILMMEAAGVIIKLYGPQNVIYPSLHMNTLFVRWVNENLKAEIPTKVLGTEAWFKEEIPSLPNKMVAIVQRGREDEICRQIQTAVEEKWADLVRDTYNWFSEQGHYELVEDIDQWLKQAGTFPTIAYAYLPLHESAVEKFLTPDRLREKGELFRALKDLEDRSIIKLYKTTSYAFPLYGYASEALDNKLSVAKNYQPPKPYDGINGFRNYPHIEKSDTGSGFEAVVRSKEKDLSKRERLDVFTATRRYMANTFEYGVPSVSEIAAQDILLGTKINTQQLEAIKALAEKVSQKAENSGYPKLQKYLKQTVWTSEVDKYMGYLGLTQALWEPENYGLTPEEIKKTLNLKEEDRIPNKIAILIMDGDKMGAWVGMKFKEIADSVHGIPAEELLNADLSKFLHPKFAEYFEKEIKEINTALKTNAYRLISGPFWHKAISSALAWFSILVLHIVKKHMGFLVYAGGDDVLAMLPPSSALRAAADIRRLYRGEYGTLNIDGLTLKIENGFIFWKKGTQAEVPIGILPGRLMTISAGIYISHFKHPLRLMLEGAKRAKNLAKDRRNSVGIIAMQRSGKELSVSIPYEKAEEIQSIYKTYFEQRIVSPRFIYEFEHDGEKFVKPEVETALNSDLWREYIAFILKRRREIENVNLEDLLSVLLNGGKAGFIETIKMLRILHYLRRGDAR